MRVAFLTNFIPPYRSEFLRHLSAKFQKLSVLISTPMEKDRAWKADWNGLDVSVQRSLTVKMRRSSPLGFFQDHYIHLPYSTLADILWRRPDVVLTAELGVRTAFAAIYRTLVRRSRMVVWATLSEVTEAGVGSFRHFARRILLGCADGCVVNGASGAAYIRRIAPSGIKILELAQASPAMPSFSRRFDDGLKTILLVTSLIDRKGVGPFLAALYEVIERHASLDFEVIVAGDGPLRGQLQKITAPRNVSVRWLGHVDYEDVAECYRCADVLAFPTLADEWGLVVNEALGAGLPILGSTASQAVSELVEPLVNGWTFAPGDHEEMITAIGEFVVASPERLTQMSQKNVLVAAALTPAAQADKLARFLRDIHAAS